MAREENKRRGTDSLQRKYVDLCAKYATLVERSRRSMERQDTVARLSKWALSVTPGGVALVRDGEITMANDQFTRLARSGGWLHDGRTADGSFAMPLRAMVLSRAQSLLRNGGQSMEMRLRAEKTERLLALRVERVEGRRVLAFAHDVTQELKRESELQQARQALIQNERLRMLGEAAGSVAHDLGSTLRSAAFRLAAMNADAKVRDAHGASVRALAEGIESAASTVRRLHDFARSGSTTMEPVNLAEILRQVLAVFELEAHKGIEVDFDAPDLPVVRGTPAELSHLFLNLLHNARDAMEDGGTIFIRARESPGKLVVEVRDEGHGVSPEDMKQLFRPFFTTKGVHGTGLGLWLASGTMARLGGSITARKLRRGMAFCVEFPLEVSRRSSGRPPKPPTAAE